METDPKRDKLLSTAQSLFMKHGTRRISIEEICREADVSKMTFYKHFKDKNELIRSILLQQFESSMSRYRAILASPVTYPEKIKAIIDLKMEQSEYLGHEFIHDLYRNADPEIAALVGDLMRKHTDIWMADFADAQAAGDIRSEIRPEFILYFMDRMTEMALDENLRKHYPSTRELLLEMMNFFFYGILARSGEAGPNGEAIAEANAEKPASGAVWEPA
jgi:AcrR family transcriptional regulator